MHCCCNVITMTTYIASKPAAPMLCALVCTMIIIGGTLASLEVQILIGHITSVDVESWRQQQKLFLSCEFFSQITFVFFSVLPGNPKITATQFLILSHFYFSRFSENIWDKHFQRLPFFFNYLLNYVILKLLNYTELHWKMSFVLVAEMQKKPHIQMLSCVQRKPVYTFFFPEKRGFEAFSYLAWHYCEQRDSVRQSLKAGVTGLKRETPLRMSKLHFGVRDYTWNQLGR